MITLFIIAAGLIGLSLILVTRESSALRVADQRGITLQTLIVTAVLVLMAVAAGVVIVAITNNANEDLEDQTTNLDSVCLVTEIYDPILASQNIKPSNGGKEGSAAGCIPVCFWKAATADDRVTTSSEVKFNRNGPTVADALAANTDHLFKNENTLFDSIGGNTDALRGMIFTTVVREVRVAPNQNDCFAYDSRGNVVNIDEKMET